MDSDQEWREAIQMYASRVDVPDTLVAGAIAGARDLAASRRRKRFLARATGAVAAATVLALGGVAAGYLIGLSRGRASPVAQTGDVPDTATIETTIAELVPDELAPTDADSETTAAGATILTAHLGDRSSAVMTVTIEPTGTPTPIAGVGRWTCTEPGCTVRNLNDGGVLMTTRPAEPDGVPDRWGAALGRPDGAVIEVSLSMGDGDIGREPPFPVETLALIAFHLNW